MILDMINDFLRMFDSYTHRKWLGFYKDVFTVEQFINISSGMPRR